MRILIVGGGLAGCEAAYRLANSGKEVVLMDKKRIALNPSQRSKYLAELVCSNSLKSMKIESATGILKREMEELDSLIMKAARKHQVPAGWALAVDRDQFSKEITDIILNHPQITFIDRSVTDPILEANSYGCDKIIIATGPLTEKLLIDKDLYFYDAISPIIEASSINFEKTYFKDRYQDGGDYLNISLSKEEYLKLVEDLKNAPKIATKEFEKEQFFESCMPIDVLARRGVDTLRFGPFKPVGLDRNAYAVIQLRKENSAGTAYGLVGCQNRLTYAAQMELFRKIPALENATFLQLGSVHRNTFVHAKNVLNDDLSLKENRAIFLAGQITGVEGYLESAATGIYVAFKILSLETDFKGTAIHALINYLMTDNIGIPTNINFGLFNRPKSKYQEIIEESKTAISKIIY